jgi:hypothetical protein
VAFPPNAARLLNEVKGEVDPRTGHEGPEYDKSYTCIFSLTSALDGGGWSTPRPVWAGAENLTPTVIQSPDRFSY